MTAPARQTPPELPEHASPAKPGERGRSDAAERAYARREQRKDRWLRPVQERAAATGFRAPFVLMVMSLLGIGLVTSLWLTTAAAADSVKLEQIKKDARAQAELVELLRREVATKESPAELDRKAREMGLLPAVDPAMLVQRPDGSWGLVGEPKAVKPAPRQQPSPPVQNPAPPANPPAQNPAPPAQNPPPDQGQQGGGQGQPAQGQPGAPDQQGQPGGQPAQGQQQPGGPAGVGQPGGAG
ncbi:hypothetical protein [Crossiella cryophila]|uniref:Cell division protein FtsL n=1 Tax=Crossiella cryophila TaxID=43355 RepID=A0A7W7CII9_9PSEU|nr:hypothetical protein [Crossiella cryophila]MBB4681765.1 hypothetical protein [Crossiella cryophila]